MVSVFLLLMGLKRLGSRGPKVATFAITKIQLQCTMQIVRLALMFRHTGGIFGVILTFYKSAGDLHRDSMDLPLVSV